MQNKDSNLFLKLVWEDLIGDEFLKKKAEDKRLAAQNELLTLWDKEEQTKSTEAEKTKKRKK